MVNHLLIISKIPLSSSPNNSLRRESTKLENARSDQKMVMFAILEEQKLYGMTRDLCKFFHSNDRFISV